MEDEKSPHKISNPSPPPIPAHSPFKPPPPPPDQRRRRYKVDLRPGETTVVSWKKLVKESNKDDDTIPVLDSTTAPAQATQSVDELKDVPPANRLSAVIGKIQCLYEGQQSSDEEELNSVPDDDDDYDTKDSFIDDTELDEYFQIENLGTRNDGFFVNKGKLEQSSEPASSPTLALKKRKKKELKTHGQLDREQFPSQPIEVQNLESREAARSVQIARNKSGRNAQTSATPASELHKKQGEICGVSPKGTTLEHAILDLEKVARTKLPTMEILKRRLPQDIKQKLAVVARLGQSSQGKISKELISRLTGILGHIVQVRTLKSHLKEMVKLDIEGKQQKANRLEEVKNEVISMISEMATSNSRAIEQAKSIDDFVEEDKKGQRVKYIMNEALEDKMSDLYELYVEGLDGDREPKSRKLYAELAELWPDGAMDSKRVKRGINRAIERKKQSYMQRKDSEIKEKKNSPTINTGAAVSGENAQTRVEDGSSCLALTSPDKSISDAAGTDQHLPLPSKTSSGRSDHSTKDSPKLKRIKENIVAGKKERNRSEEKFLRKKRKNGI